MTGERGFIGGGKSKRLGKGNNIHRPYFLEVLSWYSNVPPCIQNGIQHNIGKAKTYDV